MRYSVSFVWGNNNVCKALTKTELYFLYGKFFYICIVVVFFILCKRFLTAYIKQSKRLLIDERSVVLP